MARGDNSQRIDVAGADEVATLGHAFNQMAAQVDRSTRATRQLIADVSHDLKTPLALIHPNAQGIAVVVDRALMDFAEVNCHPLVTTATTRLATADLLRFIEACGHQPATLNLDT